MPTLPILLAALGATAALQAPPESPVTRANVQIVASLRDDLGRQIATASASFDKDFTTSIATGASGCEIRSGGVVPSDALLVWTLDGRLMRNTSTEVSLRLKWRRGGTRAAMPDKEQELTLHPGDRLPLDRVALAPTTQCRATSASLHIAALSRIEQVEEQLAQAAQALSRARAGAIAGGGGGRGGASGFGSGAGGGGGQGGGGARGVGGGAGGGFGQGAGRGARAGSSASGSAVGGAPAPTNESAGSGGVGGSFGVNRGNNPAFDATVERTRTTLRDTGLQPSTLREITVELWLVDQHDDGTGRSYPTVVRTVPGQGQFIFAPVSVPTEDPAKTQWVFVEGVVQAQQRNDGGESLYVGFLKTVSLEQTGGAWSEFMSTKRSMPMPAPGEVLEFVLPRHRPEGSATMGRWPLSTPGHTFSLRLRVMR